MGVQPRAKTLRFQRFAAEHHRLQLNTLTCSVTSKAWKYSGERTTDSGTTTSRPPCNSAPKISHTEKSKAKE